MPRWAWLLIAGVVLVVAGELGGRQEGDVSPWLSTIPAMAGIAVGLVGLIGAGIAAARPRRRD